MKILYITPPLYGFRECLFDGATEINGLPSFNKPLKKLIEEGNEIHFVILYNTETIEPFNIKADWLSESQIKECLHYDTRITRRLLNIIEIRKKVNNLIKSEKYDFVYGHGSASSIVRKVAMNKNIPFGQRLYGTFLWNEIQKYGYLKSSFKHLIEYLTFKTRKSFLLITNDGSRGDLVYNKIAKNKSLYEFLYWINGVNRVTDISDDELLKYKQKLVDKPFIFYVARFDEWKQQERAVRILRVLKKNNKDLHLYLAGPPEKGNPSYFNYIMRCIDEWDLNDNVTYMGNIDAKTINIMCKLAVASLSLYNVCNLTNVFHEMLAAGAVVIVKNDGVVNEFIKNGVNGFLVDSEEDAINIIEELINNKDLVSLIRENAIITSNSRIKTWEERIQDEIDLIKKYVYID